MRLPLLCLLALAPAWPQGFILDAERHTTYGVSDSTRIFVAYAYDGSGNRVLKRSFDGTDSTAPGLGVISYQYNAGQLIREVTVAGVDTLSDIAYAYDLSARLIRVTVRDRGGVLRYTDSLAYDGQGNRISEARILPGNSPNFILRHYYDGSNRLTSDTLFQNGGSTYGTAVVYTRDTSGKVLMETHSHFSSNAWFSDKTVEMTYASGRLITVAGYTGGGGRTLIDSLAIAYDGNGNRSEDRNYDDEGDLLERVEYFWRVNPVFVRERRRPELRFAHSPRPGSWISGRRYFDARGRMLGSKASAH